MKVGDLVTVLNQDTGIQYIGIIYEVDGCELDPWVNVYWNDGDSGWEDLSWNTGVARFVEVLCK